MSTKINVRRAQFKDVNGLHWWGVELFDGLDEGVNEHEESNEESKLLSEDNKGVALKIGVVGVKENDDSNDEFKLFKGGSGIIDVVEIDVADSLFGVLSVRVKVSIREGRELHFKQEVQFYRGFSIFTFFISIEI